ncbi:UNVERIFIED_CONTAM: hypothetical protein B566_EDAN019471, partial [Ephemera danica]
MAAKRLQVVLVKSCIEHYIICCTNITKINHASVTRYDVTLQMVSKTRVVRECCVGFEQQEQLCVPRCSESCGSHGRCVAPDVCKCDPGFHGALCNYGYEIVIPPSVYDLPTSTPSSPSGSTGSTTVTLTSTTENSRESPQILTTSTEDKLQSETVTPSTSSTDRSTSSIGISTPATETSPGTQISKYSATGNDNESSHGHGNNVVIVQHVCSMASTNTFKPEPNQATISPALR